MPLETEKKEEGGLLVSFKDGSVDHKVQQNKQRGMQGDDQELKRLFN